MVVISLWGRAKPRWFLRMLPALGVLTLGFLSQPVIADPPPDEVAAVLNLNDALPMAEERCAYTRVRSDADSLKIERYDPANPEAPWTLLNLDGRDPTPADLRRYAQRDDNRSDRRHPLAFDPRDLVRPDSWELQSDNGGEVAYRFRLRPFEEISERLAEKAVGTLVMSKDDGRLLRIRIENTEPAYPAPLVRVTDYAQELRFERDEAIGADVLVKAVTHLRGRALGLKSLDDDRVIRYEDYACTELVSQQ
jgi:hypothetical protein